MSLLAPPVTVHQWGPGVTAFAGTVWTDDTLFVAPNTLPINLSGMVLRVRVGLWGSAGTLWEGLSSTAGSGVVILDQSITANLGKARIDVPLTGALIRDLSAEIVLLSGTTVVSAVAGRVALIPLRGPVGS